MGDKEAMQHRWVGGFASNGSAGVAVICRRRQRASEMVVAEGAVGGVVEERQVWQKPIQVVALKTEGCEVRQLRQF